MGMKVFASALNYGALASGANTGIKFKAIHAGASGGTIIITDKGGTAITFAGVPAGSILPVEGIACETPTVADMVWMDW